jgi:hypothetical protein
MKIKKESWDEIIKGKVETVETLSFKIQKLQSIHGIGIFIGVGNETKRKAILVRAKLELLADKDFPDTKGLSLKTQGTDTELERYVILELSSDDYLDVFVSLCNDVLRALETSKTEEELIKRYYSRITAWKLFFGRARDGILSSKNRVGLYSELYFIITKMIPAFGSGFLDFWTGPDKKPHDFEIGKLGIEVKGTSGKKGHKIFISNEKQLDNDGLDNLYLNFFVISEKSNYPATIPAAIKDIKSVIQGDDERMLNFEEKLISVGYNYMFEDKYNKFGYHVHESKAFDVKEGFPRIISKDVPSGCGGVKYTVEISSCGEFEIDMKLLDQSLSNLKRVTR